MTGQDTVKKLIVGEEDGKEEENETLIFLPELHLIKKEYASISIQSNK